jgi:hypothetical protein
VVSGDGYSYLISVGKEFTFVLVIALKANRFKLLKRSLTLISVWLKGLIT